MSAMPVRVANRFFFFFSMYWRLNRVSMMLARVDGRPMPFSFMTSRISSLSTSFPAVSMALSSVASV